MKRIILLLTMFAWSMTPNRLWADIQVQGYLNNAALENLAGDPSCIPAATCPFGRIYWNSTAGEPRIWDGALWQQILAGSTSLPDPLLLGDGLISAPTYSFTNDTDTGLYLRTVPGEIGIAVGGVDTIRCSSATCVTETASHQFQAGAVASPSIRFEGTTAGLYQSGGASVGITAGGTGGLVVGTSSLLSERTHLFQNGGFATPSIAATSFPTTGFYWVANELAVSIIGNTAFRIRDGSATIETSAGFSGLRVNGDTGNDAFLTMGEGGLYDDDFQIQWDESATSAIIKNANVAKLTISTTAATFADIVIVPEIVVGAANENVGLRLDPAGTDVTFFATAEGNGGATCDASCAAASTSGVCVTATRSGSTAVTCASNSGTRRCVCARYGP